MNDAKFTKTGWFQRGVFAPKMNMLSGVKVRVFEHDRLDRRFEVRTIPTHQAEHLPAGEFSALYADFQAKGGLYTLEDISLESIYPLFKISAVNLYDTEERGTPRIRFFGAALGVGNAGVSPSGMPVRDYGHGEQAEYAREMARSIDTVACCGTPLFQHVMTYWNSHAYHRLLLPATSDGRRVTRVLGACVFPSHFRSDLLE